MKSSLSSKLKHKLAAKPRYPQVAGFVVFLLLLLWGLTGHAYSPGHVYDKVRLVAGKIELADSPQSTKKLGTPRSTAPGSIINPAASITGSKSIPSFNHKTIVTTYFWVGEGSSGDNGGISNFASAWDGQWQQHFGGVDDPLHRNGYRPAGFVPKENSFYFALPYNDIDSKGHRKPSAINCPLYQSNKKTSYSWCKNGWIAIRHGGKSAYAQWEDSGPFGEDDTAYVFGSSKPANNKDSKAGLDVSPAVRDFLKLTDVDTCDWSFVELSDVPTGPWRNTITSTPGESVN